jgi:sortase A
MGSSFPGVPGNMVLFGHLGGEHGTFMRLHELQPGDEFSIFTEASELRYRVRSSHETTPDDVGVLAPTDDASATLITCSGPWDPIAQTNERRLIVSADYVDQ